VAVPRVRKRTGKIAYPTLRSADHCYLRGGAVLQAVEDQLDAGGDAELVKNAKKIIPHDFLLAGGLPARRVAITSYFLTAFLGVAGWLGMLGGMRRSLILGVGIFGVLVVSASWLGAARLGAMKHSRYRAEL
jgi:threonine dehydrogenase-like Zn-dependent dehydrogenase